jgi:AcrR family transcriptional regulator
VIIQIIEYRFERGRALKKLSRKEREREMRRREIMQAAEYLFSQKGFLKTTMAEIAEKAEFALGTIYQFFKSKEELYMAIANEKGDIVEAKIEELVKSKMGFEEKLKAAITTLFGFFQTDQAFLRIFAMERWALQWNIQKESLERILKRHDRGIEKFARIIAEGKKKGLLKDIDTRKMAIILHGMVVSFAFHWLRTDQTEPLEHSSGILFEILTNGIMKKGEVS